MQKIRNGFTLIETIVVLVISTLLLSLSLLLARNLNLNHFRDYFFWKSFQNQFELSENKARIKRTSVTIEFHPHKSIIFEDTNRKCKSITPPDNITVTRSASVLINDHGHVDPSTIVWKIDNRSELSQRFQLGWGMYTFESK